MRGVTQNRPMDDPANRPIDTLYISMGSSDVKKKEEERRRKKIVKPRMRIGHIPGLFIDIFILRTIEICSQISRKGIQILTILTIGM